MEEREDKGIEKGGGEGLVKMEGDGRGARRRGREESKEKGRSGGQKKKGVEKRV